MPLEPLAAEVAQTALALQPSGSIALAGGAAMLAHGFVDRPTVDIDLFTPDATEIPQTIERLTSALRDRGFHVTLVRSHGTFAHLDVSDQGGRQVAVELAQDARMRPAVQLSIGAVLHPDELAADKVLALFGRAAARDLVDVDALLTRYTAEQLLRLATEKDPGFDVRVFVDALAAAAARPAASYEELGLGPEVAARLRERALAWRYMLLSEPED